MSLSKVSLDKQQKHFYLPPFHENYTHSTILVCFLPTISSKQLLQIRIDMRAYENYKWHKKGRENGRICLWRNYLCFFGAIIYMGIYEEPQIEMY